MIRQADMVLDSLGAAGIESPLKGKGWSSGAGLFIDPAERVRYQVEYNTANDRPVDVALEKAGPREKIFFAPGETRAAIVTCGGLSPGLNNVVRSAFLELHHNYGVREVFGIRYGYQGFNAALGQPPVRLTTEYVDDIHDEGGSVLGASRGAEPPEGVVDFLQAHGIQILLCVGGDGTQRGALAIHAEARRRGLTLAVVGVPKTIDNDLPFVSTSFGFHTAIQAAREVLECAHTEARGAHNGIGLVKLMGRYAGFIACGAALASQDVNFTLIPEVPFQLGGENGLLACLKRRLLARQHGVVVVAEGAGQNLIPGDEQERDASGNLKLKDIGDFLRRQIRDYFKTEKMPAEIKYFDPSYIVRSVPANCADAMLSDQMARHAVHAAMAGFTGLLIGYTNNVFVHVPIATVVRQQKRVLPTGALWRSVLAASGQPAQMI